MENLQFQSGPDRIRPEAQTGHQPSRKPRAITQEPPRSPPLKKALLGDTAPKIGGLAEQEEGRKVSKEQLVNRLNFINFQDDVIHIHFTHREYERTMLVMAVAPEPCLGDTLELRWLGTTDVDSMLKSYHLDFILVPRGQKFIKSVPGDTRTSMQQGVCSGAAGDQP